MAEYFYRFRSAPALLDQFHELETQEIYFASLKELNDPIEGIKDVVWGGDKIVWKNFFRHYVLCLMQSVALAHMGGKDFNPDILNSLVHQTDEDLPEAPIRQTYQDICVEFFDRQPVAALLDALSRPGKRVRRDELLFYVQIAHFAALTDVFKGFEKRGHKLMAPPARLSELAEEMLPKLSKMLQVVQSAGDQPPTFFFINTTFQQQLSLIHELRTPVPEERKSWHFLTKQFWAAYLTAVESLLYPDWHVACFMTDPTQASMWGYYGQNHQGMCLKFRASTAAGGQGALPLERATSWGTAGVGYSFVPHVFEPVQYTAEFPEIEFFQSLGRVPNGKLMDFWFAGSEGTRSEVAGAIFESEDKWREQYWKRFSNGCRIKSAHWSHEREHRLIAYSLLGSLDTVIKRKFKYKFEDLQGIIFGIKTSNESKIAAMRIIEKKCLENGRSDFEFWQAYYSHETHAIELSRLDLITVRQLGAQQ